MCVCGFPLRSICSTDASLTGGRRIGSCQFFGRGGGGGSRFFFSLLCSTNREGMECGGTVVLFDVGVEDESTE